MAQINARIAAPLVETAILKRYGMAPANIDTPLRALYPTISQALFRRLFGEREH